jgi:outer membrane protein
MADGKYSLRFASGNSSPNDLGEILSGDVGTAKYNLKVYALDAGYLLDDTRYKNFSLYLKSGLSYFDEKVFSDSYEMTLYLKLYWDVPYLGKILRVGFGEGGSYTSKILLTEYLEAKERGDNNSKYLNYLDISLDFDLGRVMSYKPLDNYYIGYALKHRSGIFGLINNVKHGGSNYNTLYIEKAF